MQIKKHSQNELDLSDNLKNNSENLSNLQKTNQENQKTILK